MTKRALISVSDKTGIVEFVKELIQLDYEIISTGGTKSTLEQAGLKVMGISEITHFPEILDGRVKTLHPLVHGGLLALRDNPSHQLQVQENKIEYIDMVVVNLYPFKKTIAKENVSLEEAIENIDIGGPSMLRSAAKNNLYVTVIVDPQDYSLILEEIKNNGNTSVETRARLAAKVFRHTASYDATIASYLTKNVKEENPESITLTYDLKQVLRYGENPHQKASFYVGNGQGYSLAYAKQLHGKELSYNNIQDGNAALQIVKEFAAHPVVVALKHMNPCGVGLGSDIYNAWCRAYESDSTSIFGGIIATNQMVDEKTAEAMSKIFLEIIIAPSFSKKSLEILMKKKNIRLMTYFMNFDTNEQQVVSVNGGLLMQDQDVINVTNGDLKVVTKMVPNEAVIRDLLFAWKVVKHVKSNAIVLVKDLTTIGIGAGQMNRIGAAKIALECAKEKGETDQLVLASDAFFPFDDVVRLSATYGVKAIIQPGGSIQDEASIKACDELGIAMIFTSVRHFKH